MAHEDELQSFINYGLAMPNNCTLLVDTYNTIEGVKKAIIAAEQIHAAGGTLFGIRLDSGDLLELSIEARKLLDDAGLEQTRIVASNDLDEYEIERLRKQSAKIDIYGVGTRLVTAFDQPALGGVL